MSGSRAIEAHLDYLAAGWRPWLLLTLLSLSLFLPGIVALPPVDRDEARYVQATRQMLETGDLVEIRFQDEARNKKPVGIYWLQAAAVRLLSDAESVEVWPYRLVSVGGATAAVLLTFLLGAAIFDRRTALVGAALLAAAAATTVEAHLATTDAVLLPAAVAAQGTLALAYLGARRGERISPAAAGAFWLAQGLAILIKGPVVPALSLATVAALVAADRRARWLGSLRPLWGLPLALAITLPWLVLIERRTGGAFLRESVGHDFLGKLAGGQEAHGAPPGFYLALLPVTFWPGSMLLGAAGTWVWRSRRLPAARLLAAWVLPFWLLLELVPTKLPHYMLPLFPALALAAARAVIALGEEGMAQPPGWLRPVFPAIGAAAGLGFGAALLVLPPLLGLGALWPAAVAAAAALAAAWQILVRERCRLGTHSAAIAVLASLLVLVPGLQLVLPQLGPIWLSRSAAALVRSQRLPGEAVSSSGYAEPSLVFLLGTGTQLLAPVPAADALAAGRVGLSLVADGDDVSFRRALAADGTRPIELGEAGGFDYSTGKWLTLRLYRLIEKPGS